MASHLDGLERAFASAPSIETAQAWHTAAIEEFKAENIHLGELIKIGNAVRAWARVNGIAIPERNG